MSQQVTFEYDTKDNASTAIDKISNKLSNLKRGYADVRQTAGKLRQATRFASGSTGGGSTLSGLGAVIGSAVGTSKSLQTQEAEKPTATTNDKLFKVVENPITQKVSEIGRMGTMVGAGVLASSFLESSKMFSEATSSNLGKVLPFTPSKVLGNTLIGDVSSNLISKPTRNMTSDIANMHTLSNIIPSVTPTTTFGGMSTTFEKPSFGGGKATKLGTVSRLGMRIGAGLATLGATFVAEAAFEVVDETINQFTRKSEFSKEGLESLSDAQLSRNQSSMIYNEVTKDQGGQMYLLREMFGMNKSNIESMNDQLEKERTKRVKDVEKALWIQNRY